MTTLKPSEFPENLVASINASPCRVAICRSTRGRKQVNYITEDAGNCRGRVVRVAACEMAVAGRSCASLLERDRAKAGGSTMTVQPEFATIQTNGIRLRVALTGNGPLVVLVHGWP